MRKHKVAGVPFSETVLERLRGNTQAQIDFISASIEKC